MGSTESNLVARALDGDAAAFAALAELHFDAAFAVALAITGVREDAEDAVQEGLVRAWRRLRQCRHPERFRAWLLSVVRTVALNAIAHRSRRTMVSLSEAIPAQTPRPDHRVLRGELRDRLEAALQWLTPVQRQVLLLYDLEGFRHRDVAELLDISETMSRRHLSDARAAMRRHLSRGQPDVRIRHA
ncbi:MAG: sigma-70 family RNA polymerase sigma factor [Gemmatimonadota bacterium]